MAHTPGPWAWFGNAGTQQIYLATTHSGRRYVMSFRRWGMRGAQPEFQPGGRGLVDASELLKFEVGDKSVTGIEEAKKDGSVYRYDIRGIDCDDARLIAAAPDLLAALKTIVKDWDGEPEDMQEACEAIAKAEGRDPTEQHYAKGDAQREGAAQ